MDTGEKIAYARTRLGISQVKLGKMIGRVSTTIVHWEDGTTRIKLEDAAKVCKALGVSLEWLAGWDEVD